MIAKLQRSRDVVAGSVGKASCPRNPNVFCLEPLDRPLSSAADCLVVVVDRFKLAESVSTAIRAAIPTTIPTAIPIAIKLMNSILHLM
jgi:hypothetical protein